MSEAKENFYIHSEIDEVPEFCLAYIGELEELLTSAVCLLANHEQHTDEEWEKDYEKLMQKYEYDLFEEAL